MCDKCKGCIHRRALSGKSAAVCQYAIDTGKLRGCEPEDCPHWNGDQKERKRGARFVCRFFRLRRGERVAVV